MKEPPFWQVLYKCMRCGDTATTACYTVQCWSQNDALKEVPSMLIHFCDGQSMSEKIYGVAYPHQVRKLDPVQSIAK